MTEELNHEDLDVLDDLSLPIATTKTSCWMSKLAGDEEEVLEAHMLMIIMELGIDGGAILNGLVQALMILLENGDTIMEKALLEPLWSSLHSGSEVSLALARVVVAESNKCMMYSKPE